MKWLDWQIMNDCTEEHVEVNCPHCNESLNVTATPGVQEQYNCPTCGGIFSYLGGS